MAFHWGSTHRLWENEGRIYLEVVRSTGEEGKALFMGTQNTHFVYENNQTNDLDTSNSDPFKVELAQKFELPLSDGRRVWLETFKQEPNYIATLNDCKRLLPPKLKP